LPLQANAFYSAIYYARKEAEIVHAVLISVALELCRDHIFEVALLHLRYISNSTAAKFGVYF